MNTIAIKNMENFAKTIISLPEDSQNEFFNKIGKSLSFEEIEILKKCVSAYKLLTNVSFYKSIQKALCEQIYKEFNDQ